MDSGAPTPTRGKLRMTLACALSLVMLHGPHSAAAVNVLTYHNDNARTGANAAETVLTPANVNACGFGKAFSQAVDGQIYAEPLYMADMPISGKGTHNVVFVCTMHDTVYAFDADSASGDNSAPLWSRTFTNPPGVTSVPTTDLGNGYGDIEREIGICGTPVIDAGTNTMYLVAKTKETSGATPAYVQRLHALDVASGAEKFGGPLTISGSVSGTGYNGAYGVIEDVSHGVAFDPRNENQRSALLLVNGIVYVAWAAHEDHDAYHGWVMAFTVNQPTQTLTRYAVFCATPNGGRAGVWQGAGGPAADGSGAIYFATGNGSFSPATSNYGDSFLKLNQGVGPLTVSSYFTPSNQAGLDAADADVGSGGPLLLPDQPGTHPHVMVGCGKEGKIYLLNRDSLGGYGAVDNVLQEIGGANNGVWGVPAYWNSHVYFGSQGDALKSFALANGQLSAGPDSRSAATFGYPGATPVVSANGNTNGILWALNVGSYGSDGPAVLYAYDASNLASELYNSNQAGARDVMGQAIKFAVPTVANGKVYVGTGTELDVFGLGAPLGIVNAVPMGNTSVRVTFTCPLDSTTSQAASNYVLDNGAAVIAANLDSSGTVVTLTTSPLLTFVPYTLRVTGVLDRSTPPRAIPPGASVTLSLSGLSGLTGSYFTNINLSGSPAIVRVDPIIDFDWNNSPPDPAIGMVTYSVRWTGYLRAPTSGPYTFYTVTDDGVRLWVNGSKLVDAWVDQAPTEHSGAITLSAGVRYPVTVEFYQNYGGSVARLLWSGPSIAKAVVPSASLLARGYNYMDVAYALNAAGGLQNAMSAPALISGGQLDIRGVTLLIRKAAGLDANP
ncbi:MAG TPA: PA14 domain-containing protein [Armatimonadota bacterium]|jgi:hypothetical protein